MLQKYLTPKMNEKAAMKVWSSRSGGINGHLSGSNKRPHADDNRHRHTSSTMSRHTGRHNSETDGSSDVGVSSHFRTLRRLCKERGTVYEDPDFPAANKTLVSGKGNKMPLQMAQLKWMRPQVSVYVAISESQSFT